MVRGILSHITISGGIMHVQVDFYKRYFYLSLVVVMIQFITAFIHALDFNTIIVVSLLNIIAMIGCAAAIVDTITDRIVRFIIVSLFYLGTITSVIFLKLLCQGEST